MQALRRLANITINEELLVTDNRARSPSHRGTKETHPANKENYIKISVVKSDTKGSRKQPPSVKKPESATKVKLSPNTNVQLKNATVTYHRGTVGGGIRLVTTTLKPKTNNTIIKKIKPTWPFTTINSKHDLNRYKNYTQLHRNSNSTKKNEQKQQAQPQPQPQPDFVLYHIPAPDPMPEVTSYSPQYTFERPPQTSQSDLNDNIVPLSAVETSSNGYPADDSSDLGDIVDIPLGTVDLDLIPDAQTQGEFYSANSGGNPCPSYHLTSNVFAPQSKQAGCPDLNVVLNSHYHPATDTRRPETEAVAPAASAPLAEPAAPAAAAAAPAAAPAAGPAGPAGAGGFPPLGVPQLPEFPMLPNLSLPDLKGLMDIFGGLWNIIRTVFTYIWPVLVAIPVIVFVKTLIATFFAIFPWWFPALFFVAKSDNKEKTHYHYKHVHKPVVHPDGWFWNHQTKTWTNILDTTKLSGGHHPYKGHRPLRVKHKRSLEEYKAKFR